MDMTFKEFTDYLLKEETWIDLGFVTLKIIFILLLTAVVSEVR